MGIQIEAARNVALMLFGITTLAWAIWTRGRV